MLTHASLIVHLSNTGTNAADRARATVVVAMQLDATVAVVVNTCGGAYRVEVLDLLRKRVLLAD